MGIIFKHTFKNIFMKTGRTFLLTFCIAVCSLAAVVCLDMTDSVERMAANMVTDFVGCSDIILLPDEKLPGDWTEGLPDMEYVSVYNSYMTLHRRDPQLYTYAIDDNLCIVGTDLEKGYDMKLIPVKLQLAPNETAMTENIAKLYGCSVGDKIDFYDIYGEKAEFTIKNIIKKGGVIHDNSCVISSQAAQNLYTSEAMDYGEILINITDDRLIEDAFDTLKERFPEKEILNIKNNGDLDEAVKSISNMFLTMFAVCLIVVIIITLTVSERIMNERLPAAGTLRSLGVSRAKTAFILLLENIIYALMGSLPAMLLYSVIREPAFDLIFTAEGEASLDFGQASPLIYLIVVGGAVLVECLCTLKETVTASRMAIRDVILTGHDCQYRISPAKTAAGSVCAVTAVVCSLFDEKFYPLIISFICAVIAIYLLFPLVTIVSSKALGAALTKLNMPVGGIACRKISAVRSTVASTALITVSAAIACAVFIFADSLYASLSYRIYDCDIVVSAEDEDFMYDYIADLDGVAATQNIYSGSGDIMINGRKFKEYNIYAMEEGDMFSGVTGIEGPANDNEIYISEDIARKTGVRKGDTIELALNCDFIVPDYFKVRVAGICSCVYMDQCGRGIVINLDMYRNFMGKYGSTKLVKTKGSPDEVIEKIRKYPYFEYTDSVQTAGDFYAESEKENHTQDTMIKLLGFTGILLTLVGVISNQLIGFHGRRRENAVLLSTSMSRRSLKKMLFTETFVSSAVSLLFSLPLGIALYAVISKILVCFDVSVPTLIDLSKLLPVTLMLLGVFSASAIFPCGALRKMKLAEQLKYE